MADSSSRTPSRSQVDDLTKAQLEAVRQAQSELTKVFNTVYNMYDDPAEIRNALLDLVPAIARKYGNLGSVAAAEWYDRMRAKWFKDDGYSADSTYDPDDVPMRKTVRRLAGNLWDKDENTPANPDLMLSGLHAAMDRWVKAGGRETITRAVKKDPSKPRFARVPQGAVTCAFCAMLAGRGFVYSSAEAAGAMNQYHHDCDCVPVPSWDRKNPKVAGYDDKEYEKRYLEARRMLENHTVPEKLMDGLLRIKPYLEPKHRKSWYGPEDPNNANSITYLMRHLHPDEFVDRVERDGIIPTERPIPDYKEKQPSKPFEGDAWNSLNGWSRNDYTNIRKVQNGEAPRTWEGLIDRYREEGDLLEESVKGYSTGKTLYRGLSMNSDDWQTILNAFPGEELNEHALSSWSSSAKTAIETFATPRTSLDSSVVIIMPHGGKNMLSVDKGLGKNRMEYEYLSSGRNRYRIISVTNGKASDIDASLDDRPITIIEVRQI
ncbi:VG15 protein [Bifidobacterium rousetti]|uniref:VG15 protein n=1 Tax=Bifidobacterium rousetti TaxID=2045439 RepID=UPI00168B367B|nr:hypothetical protein [Bifidobacterium rousetti]